MEYAFECIRVYAINGLKNLEDTRIQWIAKEDIKPPRRLVKTLLSQITVNLDWQQHEHLKDKKPHTCWLVGWKSKVIYEGDDPNLDSNAFHGQMDRTLFTLV